ncbi:MAG: bifunctional metallophosphatase/5'-nucleotidase [Thermoplasmatota archaeon]
MAHRLTILQVNDSHAYLRPHMELFRGGGSEVYRQAGGFARIATLFHRIRREREAVVVLDNGDTLHGTYPAVESRGATLVPVLNALGFDAMTGHWDFAYGPERLRELVRRLDYPLLAVNCYRGDTDEPMFPPYRVLERGGLRVAVIGVAATIVDKTAPASFSSGVSLTLGRDELPGVVERVRDGERADLVVVLSHLGFPQEMQLAADIDGIDVLVSGHTHNRLYRPALVNGTLLMQSGSHGSFVGCLDLLVGDSGVEGYEHRLIPVDMSVVPDERVAGLVDEAVEPYRDMLSEVVGRTTTALNRGRVMETTMDNLLLQAMQEASHAELAFSNGWRYGAPVPTGEVTVNDLWNIVPVNPKVSTCELSGAELRRMLEEDLELAFSRNPYGQMGGYVKRCLGLTAYFKVENPAGHRIEELYVGGRRVEDDEVYEACYVTVQGVPERYGGNRMDLDVDAVGALRRYLSEHEPARADLRGTVVPI